MKKCLVVVDYQNDFISGSLGFEKAVLLEDKIADKISQYHSNGDDVIFTFDTHGQDYLQTQEGKNLPVPHCIKGTDGYALYGKVGEQAKPTDLRFDKDTFGSDSLYQHLRNTPYEAIELTGVVSNICVVSNAVLAKTAQPETRIIVSKSCTASNDDSLNQAALDVMASIHVEIID